MPVAISDASTLIHLAKIGRLELLRIFYDMVLVPPDVHREVVLEGKEHADAKEVETAINEGWIRIVTPKNEAMILLLRRELHTGEAATLALALEEALEVVLLDEKDARRRADALNLPKTGVIGLLIRARLEGILPSLQEELDRLRDDAGFWIDDDLYKVALEAVDKG
jgi:hypothetical protein